MPEFKQAFLKEITNRWTFSEQEVQSLLLAALGNPKGEVSFELPEGDLSITVKTTEWQEKLEEPQ